MKGVRLYIEGGGDSKSQKAELRRGFQRLLQELREAVRAKGLEWDVILCGSRHDTFAIYQRQSLRLHSDSLNILLVDAEAPVDKTPWIHLRAQDGWQDPGWGDDACHLMVQTVEAWLIADPDTLAAYYGKGFRRNVLPRQQDVEAIPKSELLQALERASDQTTKGRYRKIQDCAALLERIDVNVVRRRATHCNRLFTTVMRLIDE